MERPTHDETVTSDGPVLRSGAAYGVGEVTLADRLLTRTADASFILDSTTGLRAAHWYDPETSRLDLPDMDGQRLVELLHPDDLPQVLEMFATVVNGEESKACFARIHPDLDPSPGRTLLVSLRRIDDLWPDGIHTLVWVIDADGIVAPNRDEATSLSSLGAAAPVGLQVWSVTAAVFENARFTELADGVRDEITEAVEHAVRERRSVNRDLSCRDRSLRVRIVPTLDGDGRYLHTVVSLEDVTREQLAEVGRLLAEEQFAALFESSPLATALVDLDGTILRTNETFAIVTGYDADQLVGRTFSEITHPADVDADLQLLHEVLDGTRSNYQMEKRYLHATGHEIWVELTVAPVRGLDGEVQGFISQVEDITSRRSMFDDGADDPDLTYWATHDHLTALPNRRYLEHHLEHSLERTRRIMDRPVVLFIDLDDFKPINDDHGHLVGDEALRTIARRLRSACRDDAVVARYGGDEFVVVARRMRSAVEVPLLVDRILNAVQAPVVVDDTPLRLGASVGVAVAHEGDTVTGLLARADSACYRAKREGKNRAHYDGGIDDDGGNG